MMSILNLKDLSQLFITDCQIEKIETAMFVVQSRRLLGSQNYVKVSE